MESPVQPLERRYVKFVAAQCARPSQTIACLRMIDGITISSEVSRTSNRHARTKKPQLAGTQVELGERCGGWRAAVVRAYWVPSAND